MLLIYYVSDSCMQTDFRAASGVEEIIHLLSSTEALDLVHRILLLLQVITDNDLDRNILVQQGGVPLLVTYLDEQYGADVRCLFLLLTLCALMTA